MNYTRSTPEKREGIRSVLMDPIKKKRKGEGACTKLDFSTIKSTEVWYNMFKYVLTKYFERLSRRVQHQIHQPEFCMASRCS